MNTRLMLLAALAAAPFFAASSAQAGNNDRYCREYTKTVRIGGNVESAYGTACMQPDGSWEMVSFGGNDDLYHEVAQDVYRGNGRVVRVEQRNLNYWYPSYTPVYRTVYREPVNVFRFSWNDNDRRYRGHNHGWRNDRRDRHDDNRRDNHGGGRDHHRRDRD